MGSWVRRFIRFPPTVLSTVPTGPFLWLWKLFSKYRESSTYLPLCTVQFSIFCILSSLPCAGSMDDTVHPGRKRALTTSVPNLKGKTRPPHSASSALGASIVTFKISINRSRTGSSDLSGTKVAERTPSLLPPCILSRCDNGEYCT